MNCAYLNSVHNLWCPRTLLNHPTSAWEDVIISEVQKVTVMLSPDSSHSTVVTDTYSGTASDSKGMVVEFVVNHLKKRYPCCIVWTPIPLLTYVCKMYID